MKLTLKDITSYDLEELALDFESKLMSPVQAKQRGKPKRIQEAAKLLQNRAKIVGFWDWKEEEEMLDKLNRKSKIYPYTYNAYPGGDGWLVVRSKVKLPKAELV
jgi:hypothetical protein